MDMLRKVQTRLHLLPLVGLCACQGPWDPGDSGWLSARVVSQDPPVEEIVYKGSGYFYDGRGNDVPAEFTVRSETADGLEQELFLARRGNDGRPNRGDYAMGLLEPNSDRAFVGLTTFYQRTIDGVREKYVSVDGVLTIVESSSEKVAGTFAFTAVLYCRMSVIDWEYEAGFEDSCAAWTNLDPNNPTVNVEGRFAAKVLVSHVIEGGPS